jgi:hypothetical protein
MTYENKSYDKKAYPKLVLNKLKVMEVLPLFIPHWGLSSKNFPEKFP